MKEEIASFIEKLNELIIDVDGKSGMRMEELLALVESNPDAAAAAVFVLLQAEQVQRGSRQLAFAVAAAYERATGDDSLTLRAQRTIEGGGGRLPTIAALQGEEQRSEEGRLGVLQVNESDLGRCDVYSFVRLFQMEQADPSGLAKLRGRFLMTFPPVDGDPRPVWQIPAVRAFIRKLFDSLPHFPYFLDLTPESGSFMLFFGCLAAPEAFHPTESEYQPPERMQRIADIVQRNRQLRRRQGLATPSYEDSWVYLNVMHPSVVEAVSASVVAVTALCQLCQEDPQDVLEQLLAPYSPEIRDDIIRSIAELGDGV